MNVLAKWREARGDVLIAVEILQAYFGEERTLEELADMLCLVSEELRKSSERGETYYEAKTRLEIVLLELSKR